MNLIKKTQQILAITLALFSSHAFASTDIACRDAAGYYAWLDMIELPQSYKLYAAQGYAHQLASSLGLDVQANSFDIYISKKNCRSKVSYSNATYIFYCKQKNVPVVLKARSGKTHKFTAPLGSFVFVKQGMHETLTFNTRVTLANPKNGKRGKADYKYGNLGTCHFQTK